MINPLNDRVLILPNVEDEITTSGLIISKSAGHEHSRGEVASIGEDVTRVKKGDKIIYGKHAGININYEGVEYKILPQLDIFAKL